MNVDHFLRGVGKRQLLADILFHLVEILRRFRLDVGDAQDDGAEGAIDDRRRAAIARNREGRIGNGLVGNLVLGELT